MPHTNIPQIQRSAHNFKLRSSSEQSTITNHLQTHFFLRSTSMAKNDATFNTLLSSIIQDIKSYSGADPLLPWLRGIKKMKESLPTGVLKDKLPRFLQKCTQTFESDRRYRNDTRYLRIWLQLMDFVGDPRALLKTMEDKRIGIKRALFYQAYALCYEKSKKFDEAEKMYHLGVQNLADPVDELQKSYEQFLHRMERYRKKKNQQQEQRTSRKPISDISIVAHANKTEENSRNVLDGQPGDKSLKQLMESSRGFSSKSSISGLSSMNKENIGDDTVVAKFVDKAIVGKSEAEDACHHGLVEPTINMKEAMNAINNMFKEPLDTASIGRRSHRSQRKEGHSSGNGFQVFVDENFDSRIESSKSKEEKGSSLPPLGRAQMAQTEQEPFKIFVDGEESDDTRNKSDEEEISEQDEVQNSTCLKGFVFPSPKDISPQSYDDQDADNLPQVKLREDTVVHRFVGSTILDEPKVENVCHHGLVDPTVNLKQAMDDINNMFGKPMDFVRAKRPKRQDKAPISNENLGGFSILPDDDLEPQRQAPLKSSKKLSEPDLFEPTLCTKEAIDDINKMFGMPLDF